MRTMRQKYKFVVVALLCLLGAIMSGTGAAAEQIRWHGYDKGVALGKEQQKKVLIHFYANWCGFCRKMAKATFENREIISYVNKYFIAVRVNIDKNRALSSRYRVRGVPATWFLRETGEKIDQIPGFVPPERFLPVLKQIAGIPAETKQNKAENQNL